MINFYNTDCMEFMAKCKDETYDLILTDPPYKVTARGNSGNSGGMLQKEINKKGKVFKYNEIKIETWLPEVYRILKNNSHIYIMTNHVNLHEYLNISEKIGLHFIKSLIWDKGNKIMGQAYMSQFEYILFFRKGNFKKINNCGTSDIIKVYNNKTKIKGANLHDTEKPTELLKILINNSSKENDKIFDPFAGSGNITIACSELKRNCDCCEIDKDIYIPSKNNFENHISQMRLF